jgi:hypothetical protein
MLPLLAPVSALEIRLGKSTGSLSGTDLARAEAALQDASALVRAAAGKTWVSEDGLTATAPDAASVVTVTAALRAYRNPEGFISETLGDYNYRRPEGGQAVGVYLTREERQMVKHAAKSTAYTVRTPSAMYDAGQDPALWPDAPEEGSS